MKNKQDLRSRIGTLVKNSPDLHNLEYQVGINLHTTTFFQKMVSKEVLEKGVRIKPVDYFKALVFLDYFTTVIEDNYKLCDNLLTLSKTLRKQETDKDVKDMGKDSSYLRFNLVVADAGLCAKEKGIDYYSKEPHIKNVRKRYENLKYTVDFKSSSLRKVDPYYEAIGQMVCDLVDEKAQIQLKNVTSRIEVGAVMFTGSIFGMLKDANYKSKVNEALRRKDYFEASLSALDSLSKEISLSQIEAYIKG